MSALFDEPIRITTEIDRKQALWVGLVEDLFDGRSIPRLLVSTRTGEIVQMDIGEIRTNWRYGVIPDGPKKGELGWYDWVPDDEEASKAPNPIDVEDNPS